MKRDVDTGEEGFIECFDTIGSQEEDTAVVLDVTETKKIRERNQRQIIMAVLMVWTDKTATIAFLSRSCIDLCSRKTSA